jgi:hypothetical protein
MTRHSCDESGASGSSGARYSTQPCRTKIDIAATAVHTIALILAFVLCDVWNESARLQGVTRGQARAVHSNEGVIRNTVREEQLFYPARCVLFGLGEVRRMLHIRLAFLLVEFRVRCHTSRLLCVSLDNNHVWN